MDLSHPLPIVRLQRGEVLKLDDAVGKRISTHLGVVWVTEENDLEDHIVAIGDSRVVAHGGRTLVQALEASWVVIQ